MVNINLYAIIPGKGEATMDIILTNHAVKVLDKLDNNTCQRIFEGLEGLKKQPPVGDIKRLLGRNKGKLRLRIGSYRIIYKVEKGKIYILNIGARGDIYK